MRFDELLAAAVAKGLSEAVGDAPTLRRGGFEASSATEKRDFSVNIFTPTSGTVVGAIEDAGGGVQLILSASAELAGHLLCLQWLQESETEPGAGIPYLTLFVILPEPVQSGLPSSLPFVSLRLHKKEQAFGVPAVRVIDPSVDSPDWFNEAYQKATTKPSPEALRGWLEAQIEATGAEGEQIEAWRKMLQRLAT